MKTAYDFGAAEEAAREEDKRQEIERENHRQDLRDLLSTEGGRRVVARWLFDLLGIDDDPFNTNAMLMSRNSGVRAAALAIRADILALDPKLYAQIIEERNGRNG